MIAMLVKVFSLLLLLNYSAVSADTLGKEAISPKDGLTTSSAGSIVTVCSSTCSTNSSCPPGMFCKKGCCECGVYPGNLVVCNGSRTFVQDLYCPSYDRETEVTVIGSCLRHLNRSFPDNPLVGDIVLYQIIPDHVESLNNKTCKCLNKTGILCGSCLPGHYPLAYSFSINCIPCPSAKMNWLWYIMAAYLPLTFMYLFILLCNINTTRSHLLPLVYFCQSLSMPYLIRDLEITLESDYNSVLITIAKLFLSFYGVWNLDFFRPMYSDLCLGIGILPTLALDYAIAVYPLLLIIITYFLITLHDKDYRIYQIVCRPFKLLVSPFTGTVDIKASIIDVFVTFFLFSNVKFFSVSFDFLIPAKVFRLYPDHYNYTLTLLYAGDVEYFGRDHLPYAILAIFVSCLCALLPIVVLALYPFTFFHKFLNLIPVHWHILHTFVDSFYSCYKDGTQPGTRDCRLCSVIFFILRLCQFVLYAVIRTRIIYTVLMAIMMVLYTTLIASLWPFRKFSMNVICVLFLLLLTIITVVFAGSCAVEVYARQYLTFLYVIAGTCAAFPLFYFIAMACVWMYMHKNCGSNMLDRMKAWGRGYVQLPETAGGAEDIPDRLEHSADYHRENLANFVSQQNS